MFGVLQQRNHTIDGKSVEAKAAVPKGVGSGSNLTKKLFVGGTVSTNPLNLQGLFLCLCLYCGETCRIQICIQSWD